MFRTGTHRYIFIIGDFVLKIPRIRILSFLLFIIKKNVWRYHGDPGLHDWHYEHSWCNRPDWRYFKNFVLGGFTENFQEAKCYLRTKHRLLAQLYLPLLLINVYVRENGVGNFRFEADELVYKLFKVGEREFLEAMRPCSHTFDDPDNFAYSGNYVKVLDYGEKGFENLLIKHGDKVEQLLLSVVKQLA